MIDNVIMVEKSKKDTGNSTPKKLCFKEQIMIGKSRKRQEINTSTRTIILTYALTRLSTHNALIPATGTVTMVVYFKQHVPLGRLLRIQSHILFETTKEIIFSGTIGIFSSQTI